MAWNKFKSHWQIIIPWIVAAILLVSLVISLSTAHRALYINIVGTYGGNDPGTPSLTFDSVGRYAFSQSGSALLEGNYTLDGRTITMDSDGQTYYAIYINDTVYFIQDGQAPLPFPRTSRTAIYPHSPQSD